MLYIFTILVVLLAAIGIAVFVKRRIDRDLLESNQPKNLMETNLRPLFEADEEDLRGLESVTDTIEAEVVDDARETKLEKLHEFRQTWRANPNKRDTVSLLVMASESESAAVYAETVASVLGEWRAERLNDLSSSDLAELIETHLWLLPPTERMSGKSFLIKQEIADLRE
jgi:hypothetical protein